MSDDDDTYRRVSLTTSGGEGEGRHDVIRHRRHRSSDAHNNHRLLASSPSFSDTLSLGSSSSSTTSWDDKQDRNQFARFADTMRTRVEAKKVELNATLQEKLPEWRSRGQQYGNLARETGLEWSRKGKEAVDRWKKERGKRFTCEKAMLCSWVYQRNRCTTAASYTTQAGRCLWHALGPGCRMDV